MEDKKMSHKEEFNDILNKQSSELTKEESVKIVQELIARMLIEFKKNDRSGIYAKTQTEMAYNSNKIEGSTLTPEQTSSLFNTGTLRSDGEVVYRAKDIEEMTGHFSMFNHMLTHWNWPLTEQLIKEYHYHLKAGVFEDRANGYPVGEYKNRMNYVSDIEVANPDKVQLYIQELLRRYENIKEVTIDDLARLHADFEKIHPFQDGNGRTGRMVLFKECLNKGIIPVIIKDTDKEKYYYSLNQAQKEKDYEALITYFKEEQQYYFRKIKEFLWNYDTPGNKPEESMKDDDLSDFLTLGNP